MCGQYRCIFYKIDSGYEVVVTDFINTNNIGQLFHLVL